MPESKKITFDSFIRGVIWIVAIIGLLVLLDRLSGVLLPFFAAWLIAYLIFPLVTFFQYRLRLKFRALAIFCSLLLITVCGAGVFYLLVPPIIEETFKIKNLIADYFYSLPDNGNVPYIITQYIRDNFTVDQLSAFLNRDDFLKNLHDAWPKLWGVFSESLSLLSNSLSVLMTLLYTVFILFDYDKLSEIWINLVPERYRHLCVGVLKDVKDGMNKYFRGQAIVASCVGILFCIGFLIIGFPMAISLGLLIGLLNMVPYLQLVALLPTLLLAILKSVDTGGNFWIILGSALIVFCVVQAIQDCYLTPKIMGKITGLSPAIILLSLSIWGSLMGIMGMIIALPVTTLIITYYQRYTARVKEREEEKD